MSQDRPRTTHLVAEGLAIVLSILLAFSIDAWWDTSQENRRANGVLASLDAGLEESISQLQERIRVTSRDAALVRRFMTGTQADAVGLPFDSTQPTLLAMWRPHTADNNITFVEAAIEDAGTGGLDDHELAAAIASWHVLVAELREMSAQLAGLEIDILVALGRHPEVAQWMLRVREGASLESPGPDRGGVSGEAMARVHQDPEVAALVAAKTQRWGLQVRRFEQLREASQSILSLIRARPTR
jgi:hypothetical protein